MNAQVKTETLWIPTRFALQQIPGLDVDKTLSKLTTLYEELLTVILNTNVESIKLMDNLQVTAPDMFEIFTGDHFDLISPKGVRIIKKMHDHDYLVYQDVKSAFAQSLIEYMTTATSDLKTDPITKPFNHVVYHCPETLFNFDQLSTLFQHLTSSEDTVTKIMIGNTLVTRTVVQLVKSEQQVNFSWENTSCRTIKISRSL
ncbi:hypothetical protein [Reinekea sp. G2M2-21]|uniref:hypothetical protein n=1 Tax=Reinekea sp. G2M2-21 TaxID=2788942 RepID=UPI0018AB9BCB|nr:hypothetical protein [Reinekea sp. G2M2-21]